jgi:hypothetical protein
MVYRRAWRTLAALAIAIVTVACTPRLTSHHLPLLAKGMQASDFERCVGVEPKTMRVVVIDGVSHSMHGYAIHHAGTLGAYYLAYAPDGRLRYWGYPDEYNRSTDSLLNRLMSAVQGRK